MGWTIANTLPIDGPTLPASTYGDSRPSNVSDSTDDGEERGFLPMAYDPTPAPGPPPTIARKQVPRTDLSPPAQVENRPPKDYFSGRLSAKSLQQRDGSRDGRRPESSRSVSTEREPERRIEAAKQSPHIFYQEKGRSTSKRHTSGHSTPASAAASPAVVAGADGRLERPKPQHLDTGSYSLGHGEGFKLQEVPKTKKGGPRSGPKADDRSPVSISPVKDDTESTVQQSPVSVDSQNSGVNPFDDPRRREGAAASAQPPPKHADRPARGDSLAAAAAHRSKPTTPEPPTPTLVPTPTILSTQLAPSHDRHGSMSSIPSSFADAQSTFSGDHNHSNSIESPPFRGSFDAPPPRASSRPSVASKPVANGDFVMPRQPPPPPPVERHKHSESMSTMHSSNDTRSEGHLSPALRSGALPRHSTEGGFSMEEEMTRILSGAKRESREDGSVPPSVLRRVSNAVKHGRSFSDRGLTSANKSQSPPNGSIEISSPRVIGSPQISSPTSKEPLDQLRAQNRRQAQQIADLQADKAALEEKVNSSAEIKAATSELREKRNTMVVLDTQREMVVAELESMTAHLQKAKDSSQPLDLHSLKSDILRDFADSLQRLKDHMSGQVEDLMHRRSELNEEIGTLIQMKDKGFQELEALNARNAQLQDMNAHLVHNIQEQYKANRVPNGAGASSSANGLGIYNPGGQKPEISAPSELRNLNLVNTDSSMPNLLQEKEAEPAHILAAPQVVNIRKGQPKKFNWRKGGQTVAKNVTKGIKGAFVGESVRGKEIGAPYGAEIGGVPYGQAQAMPGSEQSSLNSKQTLDGRGGAPFGFFASQKNGGLKAGALGNMKNNSNTNLATPAADPSGESTIERRHEVPIADRLAVLFGSELEARCEFEKRMIPAMVTRCVEEVEARGMEVEGVYRKSGGSGQVKAVQQGFEKDGNHDISDPDLDIHAVTSALKQYFRRLPTPLITYDVYDFLLEAGQTADKEQLAYNLRAAVAELPEHHRNCLEYLVQHLARVMAHGSDNLMTPLNLAVVFAPTIMRPISIEREMSDMSAQRIALQALLEHNEAVFAAED